MKLICLIKRSARSPIIFYIFSYGSYGISHIAHKQRDWRHVACRI